ncbi:MAG: hypothetical protein LBC97_05690 [Bifidobacteriaceae bacterium]|nr:hypothetical protein [Bifidobacteriaceae bacterium]
MAYTDAFCEFPNLEALADTGVGSDFSDVGVCNPKLSDLGISAWRESTGHAGLAGLENLVVLIIGGELDFIEQIPVMPHLRELRLSLAEDTPANRQALQDRLPNCSIIFLDPSLQDAL